MSELAWTGTDYAPTALKSDVSGPRIFKGPVDPAVVSGVVLNDTPWYDTWVSTGVTSYGPTGTVIPPQTPPYATAATTTASTLSAVQTALNAAHGGEVIEYTGPTLSGVNTLTYVAGSENWTRNVLIRPPLGTRAQLGTTTGPWLITSDSFTVRCSHVTMAGFNIAGMAQIQGITATEGLGSGYWRCVDVAHGNAFWRLFGPSRSFLVECVGAQRVWNSGSDRVDIYAAQNFPLTQSLVDSCYFRGKIVGVQLIDSNGTPTSVWTLRVDGPLKTGTGVASATVGANWTAASVMVHFDSPGGGSASVAIRRNGTTVFSVTCPVNGPDRSDYVYTTGLSLSGSSGDVISVDITSVTGSPVGLTVDAGPVDPGHTDTLQFGQSNTATVYVDGATLRNNVLEGSSNAAIQTANGAHGDFLYESNWIGRDNNYAINLAYDAPPFPDLPIRLFASNNYFMKYVYTAPGTTVQVYKYNLSETPLANTSFVPDATNAVTTLDHTLPPLASLSRIWPECPFFGDPFA